MLKSSSVSSPNWETSLQSLNKSLSSHISRLSLYPASVTLSQSRRRFGATIVLCPKPKNCCDLSNTHTIV